MPYVQRNPQNAVCGTFRQRQPGIADEFLDADNAEVLAYENPPPPPPTQDEIDAAAAKAHAKLTALRGMTPAQVGAWVDANVTNLAQAQDAIKTLAVGMSVLARRL